MGFKIRKSLKIAPGLRINLSKSGVSASVGKPGATVNVGKNGVKSTVGIPGTGISHTTNHSGKKQSNDQSQQKNKSMPWLTIALIIGLIWAISKAF